MTFIERSVIGIPSVKTCHVLSSGEQFLEADRFIDLFRFSVLLRDGLDRYANLVHPKLGPCLWKLDALRITDQQYLTAMAEGPSNRIDMPEGSILWVWPVHFEAHPKTAGSEVAFRFVIAGKGSNEPAAGAARDRPPWVPRPVLQDIAENARVFERGA